MMPGGSVVWDNHVCLPLRLDDESFLPQLARHRAAGANIVSINAGFGDVGFDRVVATLAVFRRWFAAHGDEFLLVRSPEDVETACASNRLGIVFDVEGGDCLGEDPSRVEALANLGVRWLSLAYNRNNRLGGGCQDDDTGLTPLGAAMVEALEHAGVVVCCSHTGARTAREIFERATRPVIFSHSNPSACWSHPRNIDDSAIRACAATGGVVGINGIGIFLGRASATVHGLVRHVEHVAALVGPAHVAIALDYIYDRAELDAYVLAHPELFPPAEGYGPGITMLGPESLLAIGDLLLARGWSVGDVAGVLGGNWRRIASRCWRSEPKGVASIGSSMTQHSR